MNVPKELLERAIGLYPPGLRIIRSLGGSDGAVYEVVGPGGPCILKIIPMAADDLPRIRAREAFRSFVAQQGVATAALVAATGGEDVPILDAEDMQYALTLHARITGQPPDLDTMLSGDGELLQQWGQLLGRMHALAPGFESEALPSWEDECSVFALWCKEDAIRDKWEQMKTRLSMLSQEPSAYGVVHNDLHQNNLILSPEGLVAIDFSVCCYHWFCTDIGVAAFMWAWLGKPRYGETRTAMLRRCFGSFYGGYSKEHQLTDGWLEQLPLFLDYRRMLLYTVFTQEWGDKMNTWQRNTLSSWRQGILTGLPVVRSLV